MSAREPAGRDEPGWRHLTRRALLGCLPAMSALALGGCGFRPLYGSTASGGSVDPELAAIYLPVFPERSGQLIRQALQARLTRAGSGVAKKYTLDVAFGVAGEGLGIQPDSSLTRLRLVGTARWSLTGPPPYRQLVTSGSARSLDGLNIINQQFFATDLGVEASVERLANQLADQIVQQLAVYFQSRAARV